ncbi:MAG TPA: class I SAM-dependent methyltransferase [Candidatus Paceibacterota bacterium]|nr:class I SAM-dependent methyltransferase [Candidatus Paceibacterota bacterium]
MPKAKPMKQFIEATSDNPPRPLLVEAMNHVSEKDAALDLGAGALNDSKYMLTLGFKRVDAVDMAPASKEKASDITLGGFTFHFCRFDEYKFPKDTYDLVNAQYALPFNPPETFGEVLKSVVASLKEGGVFVGQFFGDRDSWNVKGSKKTFHTIEEARKDLAALDLIEFREEERDGVTVSGEPKHWHVFHFIAIKV